MEQYYQDKDILVTGGAGFIGSYVVDKLIEYKAKVTVVDSYITGKRENVEHHIEDPVPERESECIAAKYLDGNIIILGYSLQKLE